MSSQTQGNTTVSALNQGFDTVTGSARSTILQGDANPGGTTGTCQYMVCQDIETVSTALDISASASVSFGFGSVTAKSEFMQSMQMTTHSVSVVVYASRLTRHDVLSNVRLRPGVPEPTASTLNAFYLDNGDSYVSEIVMGAEYMAAYVFYAQSESEKQSVVSSLSASGITEAGTVSADFATSIQNACTSSKVNVTLRQKVTGLSKYKLPQDAAGIVDYALNFGSIDADSPVLVDFVTTGYEHVPGLSLSVLKPLVDVRNLCAGVPEGTGLHGKLLALEAIRNQVDSVRAVYAQYGYAGDTGFAARAAAVDADRNTLSKLLNTMSLDATASYAAPPLPSLAVGAPALVFQLNEGPLWGSIQDVPFNDVGPMSVYRRSQITEIELHGDKCVDQLTVVYSGPDGESVCTRGGDGGISNVPFTLNPDERINAIGGRYATGGDCQVLQLDFQTNQNRSYLWPTNQDWAGDSFTWQVPAGEFLLGFQGAAGGYLQGLQAVTCAFSPATWQ